MNPARSFLLLCYYIHFILCAIESIEDEMCDVVRENVVLEIFKDKQTIATIAPAKDESLLDLNCMLSIPLMHFENTRNVPVEVTKSIMMDFDRTGGVIYHGNAENLLEQVLPNMSKFNPKLRLLLLLTGTPTEDVIEKIFVDGWNKHRFFDIFIIIDEEFKRFYEEFNVYVYKLFTHETNSQKLLKIGIPFMFGDALEMLENFKEKRFRDLNGYQLKVVLFRFLMVCDGDVDESGGFKIETLKYQDAESLKILSKYMNFSIKFVKSEDGVNHGYLASDGKFTGSLGMIEYEKADFAANARLVAEYNTSNTLCLFPTTTTKLRFTVPRKYWDEVNILKSIYHFLDKDLKISLLMIFVLAPLVIFIFDKVQGLNRYRPFESLISNYLMFYAIMTFISVKLPKHWTSRWIIGGVIIIWLIIGNIYSSKMIEFLNTNSGLKQIESIEEIIENGLTIKIPYPMVILFEGNYENTSKSHRIINEIVRKSRELERAGDKYAFIDVDNMAEMIRSKKYALLFLDNLIERLENEYFDANGQNILTHIEKTPYEYNYATSVPKTSPFVEYFNEILMKIFEAGISKYQMSMAMIENELIYIKRIKDGNVPDDGLKIISFKQFYSVFYLYAVSLGLATSIFAAEIVFSKVFCRGLRRIWRKI